MPIFEAEINRLCNLRDGVTAIQKFVHDDPEQHFARMWNTCMTNVLADYIERAYLQPQAVLAAKITAGVITTYGQLLGQCSAVLLMTALHFKTKSYHRKHPRLKGKKPKDGETDSPPFFVQLNGPDNFVSRVVDPAMQAEINEEKGRLPGKARQLPRRQLQAYRRVKEYELGRGSLYGAFRHVARMAVVDGDGRIVKFRINTDGGSAYPTLAVVRQVRRLYMQAAGAFL